MATNARLKALIEELLERETPLVRKAFLEAIADARDAVVLQDVVDALTRGDIEAAARAIDVNRAFLAPLDQALTATYYRSGRDVMAYLMAQAARQKAPRLEVRFDPGHQRAAAWAREHAATLVRQIVEDQRVALRQELSAGLDAGKHPRSVALEIVGRVDRGSNRRSGGIVGLTSGQAAIVRNARAELSSGDPAAMAAYFKRKLRDRRFDSIVRQAIREGKPVGELDIRRIVARYADRMLYHRGETIARTEMLSGFSNAQAEAIEQLLESGRVRPEHVTKIWSATMDPRTRDSHMALNGQSAALRAVFISPLTGALMLFPRDTSHRAPGREIINCRCYCDYQVDWTAALLRRPLAA